MEHDWGRTVVGVVDKWLFADDPRAREDLPTTLVVPLENPHLHDDEAWQDTFGPPLRSVGLVDVHVVSDHPGRGEAADGVALAAGHRSAREVARAVATATDS